MESSIVNLDNKTDETTKQMLQKLVEKKRKFDGIKDRHRLVMWLTILLTVFYFMSLYRYLVIPYSYSFAVMFSKYVQETINLYCLIVVIGLFGLMNVLKQKTDKAEKEYHLLRCEIIDKSSDLWKQEVEWKNRHHVFKMMKEQYDINLFHETK